MKKFYSILFLALLFACTIAFPSQALAATFLVNSTVDDVDASPGDGICETATSNECTVRAAVMEANAYSGVDLIAIPSSTYTLNISGEGENAAAIGDLDLTENVRIAGQSVGSTTVQWSSIASCSNRDRIFHVMQGVTAEISDLTLQNGCNDYDEDPPFEPGAGIWNEKGTLTVFNIVLTGHHSEAGPGGAIFNTEGYTSVDNATMSANRADLGNGGSAIGNIHGWVDITDSYFTAHEGANVVLNMGPNGRLTLTNSEISDNTAINEVGLDDCSIFGGGLYNASGIATVSGSLFNNDRTAFSISSGRLDINEATVSGNGSAAAYGGVLYNCSGTVNINGGTYSNNLAYRGGSIYNNSGTVNITNAIFSGNYASPSSSGVTGGTIYNKATLKIDNSDFFGPAGNAANGIQNTSTGDVAITGSFFGDFNRGAIRNLGGEVSVGTSYFEGNTTYGAIVNNDPGGIVTVDETGFFQNGGSGQDVGAIQNTGGELSVTNSTFTDNTAYYGGAIYSDTTTSILILGSTFAGNTANGNGGAIFYSNSSSSNTHTIANSTFNNNSAADGGAIFAGGDPNFVSSIINVTIAGNDATNGGGIYQNAGALTLKNTIVSGNSGSNCYIAYDPVTDGGNNLQYPGTTCGNTITSSDPLLNALADNGGPTYTMSLQSGSPAIDTGNNTVCAASPINNVDQRGTIRPADGNVDLVEVCDIGAFELQLPTPESIILELLEGLPALNHIPIGKLPDLPPQARH